ncbi:anthranilate phosphoribosyltransferase [Thiohalocapsa marina]|uniref:Anthranilate phosphoribosyltransferase n=1 Tax=Thiohalocapsa marina TaxID=424902 RepID=A0A5M8FKM8_9GAMM|nr:anthranilate phosphoribosyltransferase [Thiohalocapsa marina]KAA6185044.1 anthranilate phosphoribosyltransferase [Thiohalocapsa marina]
MIRAALRKLTVGEHLQEEEISRIIGGIRSGEVTDVQIAGFLVALLMKGPTILEAAAIARAMRANCEQIRPEVDGELLDTCGTGGGRTTFNCSTTVSLVAAAAGIPVAKHGSRSLSSSSGSADVLERLGVAIDLSPAQAQRLIERVGISFLYAPNFHPVMHRVLPPEMALGIKTIFYTIIGPLINPADARCHLLGVYKSDLVSMMADILVELEFRHALVVHGLDGLDEISVIGKTSVAEVKDGWAKKYEVTPADFGLKTYTYEELLGGDPAQNAELVRAILTGTEQGARRAMVIANAAAALLVGGKATDLGSGARLAADLIDSGAARQKLDQLIAESNRIAAEGR